MTFPGPWGLAYPVLYVGATHVRASQGASSGLDGANLAAAVLLAETLGERTGTALGSGVVDLVTSVAADERLGLHLSTTLFAILVVLALATLVRSALGTTRDHDARE